MTRQEIMLNEYRNRIEVADNVLSETRAKLTKAEHDRDRYKAEIERLKAQQRKIDDLKAENKQLKTECALLDDELRIARQDTINVLNELKTKLFTIFGKTICSDLDTEDITDIIDELLREYKE